MATIGFIGLGIMGAPMAGNLLKGGHKLFVHTASSRCRTTSARRPAWCADSTAVAQTSRHRLHDGARTRPTSRTCCSAMTASPTG